MANSGYTAKDAVFYGGLFAGLIIVKPLADANGYHPLLGLLGGGIVGMGLGTILLKAFESMKAQGRDDSFPRNDDDGRF